MTWRTFLLPKTPLCTKQACWNATALPQSSRNILSSRRKEKMARREQSFITGMTRQCKKEQSFHLLYLRLASKPWGLDISKNPLFSFLSLLLDIHWFVAAKSVAHKWELALGCIGRVYFANAEVRPSHTGMHNKTSRNLSCWFIMFSNVDWQWLTKVSGRNIFPPIPGGAKAWTKDLLCAKQPAIPLSSDLLL